MTTASRQIEMLGFDVFGTVVDWRSSIGREVEPFLDKHRIPIEPLSFADEWRHWYQPSMEDVRSGQRDWVSLEVLHRESLEKILSAHGVELPSIPEFEMIQLTRGWERLDPWPDVRDGLRRLKTRFPIITISNGHVAGMMRLARYADLPWDAILGAEIAQSYKPQPRTYLKSAKVAGIEPSNLALVAAHNDDLSAARACGLKTIFIRRTLEWGPGQVDDLGPREEWDIVADSFIELADLLGCPR